MPYYPPPSTATSGIPLANFQAVNNNSTVQYWLIATLPVSASSTYDSILVQATTQDTFSAADVNYLQVELGKKTTFTYKSQVMGYVSQNAGIRCYLESGGTVSVYAYLKASTFSAIIVSILNAETINSVGGTAVTVYSTPTLTTTPTGTLNYDSTNATTYPPIFCAGSNSANQIGPGTSLTISNNTVPIAVFDTTSNAHGDYVSRRTGTESANLFQGSNIQLSNATSGSGTLIQNYAGNTLFASSTSGSYTEKMRLDSSGNLGLGVTPSAWTSGSAMQFSTTGAIASGAVASGSMDVANNAYDTIAGSRYITTAAAQVYRQASSIGHLWYVAPSGTAGTAITFTQAAMLLNNGNFAVGYTTDQGYKLQVNGTSLLNGDVILNGNVSRSLDSSGIVINGGTSGNGGQIAILGNAAAANAGSIIFGAGTGVSVNTTRLTTSNNFLLGTLTEGNTSYKLQAAGPILFSGNANAIRTVTGTTDTAQLSDGTIIHNTTSTTTQTLPAASAQTGAVLYFMNQVAGAVNSASSNVIPAGSSSAGTAILAATAGKWAMLQSDGSNWRIIMNN